MALADDRYLVDAAARCLAKRLGYFVSAAEWQGKIGNHYRSIAKDILLTIENVQNGNRTGGL